MYSYCRTYDNYSIVTSGSSHDYWGLCKPECRGEMPGPESEYNLAKMHFQAGFCYTYDPPQKSGRGVSNGLYFMLGHKNLFRDYQNISKSQARDSSYLLYSFDIYLHEKVNIDYINGYFLAK